MAEKAHQRLVRESASVRERDGLFGPWWESIDIDIKKAEVRPVDHATAKRIIEEYEWLGCMPAVVWYRFGIFFEGNCGGVVCFGPEYSENLGIQAREQGRKCADWSKYGYEGKMILLSRGGVPALGASAQRQQAHLFGHTNAASEVPRHHRNSG